MWIEVAQISQFTQAPQPASALYTTRRNAEHRSTEDTHSTTYHPDQMNDQSGAGGWLGQDAVMEWISCCHQGESVVRRETCCRTFVIHGGCVLGAST